MRWSLPTSVLRRCGSTSAPCPCHDASGAGTRSTPGRGPARAPAIVSRVLAKPGAPLEANVRQTFESRLGHDFSRVQVHTDSEASESSQAVGARAYTVDRHMVFATGQYQPSSGSGLRLLAHELAHVVQQDLDGSPSASALKADSIVVGDVADPLEHSAGRAADAAIALEAGPRAVQRPARGLALAAGRSPANSGVGGVIMLRRACPTTQSGIGSTPASELCDELPPTVMAGVTLLFCQDATELTDGQEAKVRMLVTTARSAARIDLHGNASPEGPSAEYNYNLACKRAGAIAARFRADGVTAPIVLHSHGPIAAYGTAAANRNVVVLITSPPTPAPTAPAKPVPTPTPAPPTRPGTNGVCGPDITAQVSAALSAVSTTFTGLSSADKDENCDALDKASAGAITSWDILPLYSGSGRGGGGNSWIYKDYRPACATAGATPPCGSSVQVGTECYFSGTANYVLYGVACKLCYDHYSASNPGEAPRFTKAAMLKNIYDYKGPGSLVGTGANWKMCEDWSSAGYDGWPSGGTPPSPADKANCSPTCPTRFSPPPDFNARWCPHVDPASTC